MICVFGKYQKKQKKKFFDRLKIKKEQFYNWRNALIVLPLQRQTTCYGYSIKIRIETQLLERWAAVCA